MTFIVAYAGQDFALVAADTRGYQLDFTAGARPRILERRDGISKIRPLPGGWLVGASSTRYWPQLVPAIAAHPAHDVDGIRAALRERRPQILGALDRCTPAERAHIVAGAGLWSIYVRPEGFGSHAWHWATGNDEDDSGFVRTCLPAGLEDQEPQLLETIARYLEQLRVCGLTNAVRLTGRLFALIRQRAGPDGSVSDAVEMGVLTRDGGGAVVQQYIGPVVARSLVLAPGRVIRGLLTPPGAAGEPAFGPPCFALNTKTMKVGTTASPSSITKNLRFMATVFQPISDASNWSYGIGTLIPNAVNLSRHFRAPVVMPAGVTIEAVRGRMKRTDATNDIAEMKFYRIADDGSATLLLTLTHSGTGPSTVVDTSISEAVTTTQYVMTLELKGAAAINDASAIWFEIEYTMPSYDKGY